jgi:hypothetical protein
MRSHPGSVVLDCSGVFAGVIAPHDNLVTFCDLCTGRYISHTNFSDVCGILPAHTKDYFLLPVGSMVQLNLM